MKASKFMALALVMRVRSGETRVKPGPPTMQNATKAMPKAIPESPTDTAACTADT
jgi:hypothetical protein